MAGEKVLRVRARIGGGNPMVADYAAQRAGIKRFIGRKYDVSVGPAGGFPSTGEVVEVPATGLDGHDYREHVASGELWAADAETAAVCGVKFDPTFGGEDAVKG